MDENNKEMDTAQEAKATKKCIKCGMEIDQEENFCHHCGADQSASPEQETTPGTNPEPPKKGGPDKRIIAAIAIGAVLLIIAFAAGRGSSKKDNPASEETVEMVTENSEQEDAVAEVAEVAAEEEAAVEEGAAEEVAVEMSEGAVKDDANTDDSDKRARQDTFDMLAGSAFKDAKDGRYDYGWDYDRDTYVINITYDGVAEMIANYSDNAEFAELWQQLCGSVKEICTTSYAMMQSCGLEDCHVNVNILNDKDKEKVLYSVLDDGVVVYDVMAE